MSILGSVFLGDVGRQRLLSTSSSPPASPASFSSKFTPAQGSPSATPPSHIDPELSLLLRVKWLESLVLGVKSDISQKAKQEPGSTKATLLRRTADLQKKIYQAAESNDTFKKFLVQYDRHPEILNPSFALSGAPAPPEYNAMTSDEFIAYLTDMEPEIRQADRDMRDIEALETRGTINSGKLGVYEELLPRLEKLLAAHDEDLQTAANLENRIASLLQRYSSQVDALSQLSVDWDSSVTAMEKLVSRLGREKAENSRLGVE